MIKNTYTTIIAILITLMGCSSGNNYIIPVDFNKYEKQLHQGKALTQNDINKMDSIFFEEIMKNTIGKKIPKILIEDTARNQTELRNIISDKTLLLISDAHCGWGRGSLTEDTPVVLEKLERNNIKINIVCLLVKDSSDYANPESYDSFLNELKAIYTHLYIITKSESGKLNVIANPTRILVSKDHKVLDYCPGSYLSSDLLYDELLKSITKIER